MRPLKNRAKVTYIRSVCATCSLLTAQNTFPFRVDELLLFQWFSLVVRNPPTAERCDTGRANFGKPPVISCETYPRLKLYFVADFLIQCEYIVFPISPRLDLSLTGAEKAAQHG